MAVQPTRLPQSLQQFEGRAEFLPIAYGTGFVVREGGYVVTALHVVRKADARKLDIQASAKQVVVCLNAAAGAYECKEVEVVATDDRNDLAILKIKRPSDADTLLPLALTAEEPAHNADVWGAGYPDDSAGKLIVNSGKFSGGDVAKDAAARRLWLAEIQVENGESGGPVLRRDGAVIGVMVTRSDSRAITGIVPAQQVIDLLARSGVTSSPLRDSRNATAGP
jgi:S1-C subfamily serine protease